MKRFLLFAALIAWSGMASAVVYKWTDAQGKVLYGDRPPDGVHAQVVELLGTHAASERVAAPPSTAQSAATARVAASTPTPKELDDKKAVDQDVAQTRDKQCADAQERYKKLIEGRRLFKTGPDGERKYMTSEEIDTERLGAKRDIDNICNSAT
jgi:Ni/Co efflux regulator RcnB